MPFNIVEIRGPKGYGELCISSDEWIQGTSSGKTFLVWPKRNATKQCMDENSVLQTGWARQECRIKRQGIESYEDANAVMREMSRESSSEWSEQPMPVSENTTKKLEVAQKPVRSNYSSTEPDVTNSIGECVHCPCVQKLLSDLEDLSKTASLFDELVKRQQKLLIMFQSWFDIIMSKMDTLLNVFDSGNIKDSFGSSFQFNRSPLINCKEELEQFDSNLGERKFAEEVTCWLNSQISDKHCGNRMTMALDLIFGKSFLVLCSWSGIGKSGPKIALNSYRYVTKLFQRIGSTELLSVTDDGLRSFFMNKLEHSQE